jgi:hypothetical protein
VAVDYAGNKVKKCQKKLNDQQNSGPHETVCVGEKQKA